MEKPKSRGGWRPNSGLKPYKKEADKKRTRSIMLTDDENQKLTELAEARGVTRSVLIALWIEENSPKTSPK